MKPFWITTIGCIIFGKISADGVANLNFPTNFMIGAGSSAYQIEGAWNVDGKGESVWDRWMHDRPEKSNGDVAANSYYKYKEDVQLAKSIGLDFYRYSISWSRVLPTGRTNVINEEGLQYYKNLTAELVANKIEPVVTLYHWDHPQLLEEFGGWTNELMVDWFVSYARIIFEALGDNVKIWTTINEPNNVCGGGYEGLHPPGILAPGKKLNGVGLYHCMHNLLKAHALTYHMYDEEFRKTQKGEIGIVAHCRNFVALNASDVVSVDTAMQFECGWVYHAIYMGDYPEIMKTRIAMISKAQGYQTSRLPEFSEEWISRIKGTADYYGLNHYSTTLVSPDPDEGPGAYKFDNGLIESVDVSWPKTSIEGLYVVPAGFGDLLRWIKDTYGNPPVRVMEIGYSGTRGLKDYKRISFHHDYLVSMLKAVYEYGCNVKSYSIWTLFDDLEWNSGYVPKFGMFSVDFNDTDRPRIPRLSASWWKIVLENREVRPVPTGPDLNHD